MMQKLRNIMNVSGETCVVVSDVPALLRVVVRELIPSLEAYLFLVSTVSVYDGPHLQISGQC
jgi:hypothetical protein